MEVLNRQGTLERLITTLSRSLEWVGLFGFLAMFVVNLVDVVGAKLLLWPMPGAVEVIGFFQVVAIAPPIAYVLLKGQHIRVDFLLDRLSPRPRGLISAFSSLLGLAVFALLAWQSLLYGQSLLKAGEIGSTSRVPFYPFAFLIALSAVPVCLVFLLEVVQSLSQVVKHGSR